MARSFVPVYSSLLTSEKWDELSFADRGAWVTTLLLGTLGEPEGVFRRRLLVSKLRKEGCSDPDDTIDRLIEAGFLDADGDDVEIHDREDWQRRYRGPSDDPAAKRDRMRRHRAEQQRATVESHASHGAIREGREGREEKGSSRARATLPSRELVTFWTGSVGTVPSPKELEWLFELERDHSREAVEVAVDEAIDGGRTGLLKRVSNRLKTDAIERTRDEDDARRRAAEADAEADREQLRTATPEEIERAGLMRSAIRIGLSGVQVPVEGSTDELRAFVDKHRDRIVDGRRTKAPERIGEILERAAS